MKYENFLIDKLYDNIGSCVIIGNDDLLSTKLEKYLKRYMGKSIKLNYPIINSNSFQSLNSYFSFISPKYIILLIHDSTLESLIEKILSISKLLNIELLVLLNTKDKKEYIFDVSNIKVFNIPNIYGFNEELGELEKKINYSDNESITLIEEIVLKITKSITSKNLIDLESKLSINKFNEESCNKIAFKQKYCSLRLLYKGNPNEYILGKNVGDFRINLGFKLADKISENIISKIDYIVPVPSSGIFYAVGISKKLKIPFLPALKKLEVSERAFEIQNIDMRKSYLSKNMEVNSHLIKGKKLLIVDEAIFTGATLKVVCELLKDNGASEVHIAIPSPKCYRNCEYLVQPDRTLLLNKINENSISRYFDVESVTYIDIESYKSELRTIENICIECFHSYNEKGE